MSIYYATAVAPALSLLGGKFDSPQARVMLMAIGHQESGFASRRQVGGPAHGFWQFELNGVRAVLNNDAASAPASHLCQLLDYPYDADVIYHALADNDVLAAGFARLLLWSDPHPLPAVGAQSYAWDYYKRNWRPGKPRPEHWAKSYDAARQDVGV